MKTAIFIKDLNSWKRRDRSKKERERKMIKAKLYDEGYLDKIINFDCKNLKGTYIENLPRDMLTELKEWLPDEEYYYERLVSSESLDKMEELVKTYEVKIMIRTMENELQIYETTGNISKKTYSKLGIYVSSNIILTIQLFRDIKVDIYDNYLNKRSKEFLYRWIRFYFRGKRKAIVGNSLVKERKKRIGNILQIMIIIIPIIVLTIGMLFM